MLVDTRSRSIEEMVSDKDHLIRLLKDNVDDLCSSDISQVPRYDIDSLIMHSRALNENVLSLSWRIGLRKAKEIKEEAEGSS